MLASIRLAFSWCTRPESFVLNGAAGSLLKASIGECFGFVNKNLLGSMCNVRTLELWGFSYQSAKLTEDEKKTFPKLKNLTTLLMGEGNMKEEFDVLRFFLENVPSLVKVTLRHCKEVLWLPDLEEALGAVGRSGSGVASEMMETPPDMSDSKRTGRHGSD
ncbi:hypothetical protein EJB05_51231, partial [Eragrostis curvula]